jgi:hypothetical protein
MFPSPARRRQAEQFDDLLEGRTSASGHELESLLTLATSMRAPEKAPSPDFSSSLRARLVEETSQRSPATQVPTKRSAAAQQPRSHRIRQAVAALTAVAIIGGAGAAAASSRALPGDSLYGLKRGLETAQLSLAGSELARGRELLEQADARLGEAEKLAASRASDATTRDRIGQALSDMDAALSDGSTLLTDVYEETGDPAALELLDGFVLDQQRRLDALLGRLASIDPALRDQAEATADLLASLHAEITALSRPELASPSEDSGAARDRSPVSGDADNLLPVDGTGSSPSAGVGATDGGSTGDGPLGEISGDVEEGADSVLPPEGGTTATTVVPTVPVPLPSVAVPEVELDVPCVPVAPLTTC